jgi:hypothetical protein
MMWVVPVLREPGGYLGSIVDFQLIELYLISFHLTVRS